MQYVRCAECGNKYIALVDYAEHVKIHPMKCIRCKDWFYSIEEYIAHFDGETMVGGRWYPTCRSVRHMED